MFSVMNKGIKIANIRERMRILRVTLTKRKKMKLQHSRLDETSARELIPRKSQYRNHKPCKTASFKEDLCFNQTNYQNYKISTYMPTKNKAKRELRNVCSTRGLCYVNTHPLKTAETWKRDMKCSLLVQSQFQVKWWHTVNKYDWP